MSAPHRLTIAAALLLTLVVSSQTHAQDRPPAQTTTPRGGKPGATPGSKPGGKPQPQQKPQKVRGSVVLHGVGGDPEHCRHGVIKRDVARRVRMLRYCYERSLRKDPELRGELRMRWTISPRGRVTWAHVSSSTIRDKTVELCVKQAFKRSVFKRGSIGQKFCTASQRIAFRPVKPADPKPAKKAKASR